VDRSRAGRRERAKADRMHDWHKLPLVRCLSPLHRFDHTLAGMCGRGRVKCTTFTGDVIAMLLGAARSMAEASAVCSILRSCRLYSLELYGRRLTADPATAASARLERSVVAVGFAGTVLNSPQERRRLRGVEAIQGASQCGRWVGGPPRFRLVTKCAFHHTHFHSEVRMVRNTCETSQAENTNGSCSTHSQITLRRSGAEPDTAVTCLTGRSLRHPGRYD
jgi:hypothetical protein